jgi:tyrosine-protein kinase Etk/Wzc
LGDYLGGARSLRLIVQDARSLAERLEMQDADLQATLSEELAALYLEIDALNSGGLPIELQVTGEGGIERKTVGEQVAFLDALAETLQAKMVVLEAEAEALEPDILALQEALQRISTEEDRLTRARNMAQETYTTLSRKVAEMRIAAEDQTGDVRLASQAAVPEGAVAPRKLLNTAVAGALGLFVGVFGAFAIEYWRAGQEKSTE